VVLFVGGTTYVRLVEVNNEDVHWVYGMNRLRHAYLDMEPDLEPYFVTGYTDDDAAIVRTYGSHGTGSALSHALVTTPATIAFVNAMIAAILGALALMEVQMGMVPAVAAGAVVFLAVCAVQIWFNQYSAAVYQREHAKRDPAGG
jgi:hypothetical protein